MLWLGITAILGGVLTTQQPDAPRLLAALPAICLLLGGLAHTLLATAGETGLRDAKPLLALALAGSLVVISILNVDAYLYTYPPAEAVQPVTLITDVGRFLARQPATQPVILYDNREFYLAHWTIQLLAPRSTGVTEWTQRVYWRQPARRTVISCLWMWIAVQPSSTSFSRSIPVEPG